MGLLSSLINGGSGHRGKNFYGYPKEEGKKIYKIVNTVAVVGVLVALTILVVALFTSLKLTSGLVGFLSSIVIVCFGLSNSLYWIMRLEKKQFKKTSITFLSAIAVCIVLWIICLWLGISLYRSVRDGNFDEKKALTFVTIMQVVLIVSLQFFVASYVAKGITRYKKEMLIWQIIAYVCYLYIDFYATFFICCFNFTGNGDILNENVKILIKAVPIMFLVLTAIYAGVANGMMQRREMKRLAKVIEKEEKAEETENKPQETTAEKLEKLKKLLEENLITQEEYDKKREELIKDL